MSTVDISYALGQMEKYGNIIIGSSCRLPIRFITNPEDGQNYFDRALGRLVVIKETDEAEYRKRALEFGLGDVRSCFDGPVFYYLAVAE